MTRGRKSGRGASPVPERHAAAGTAVLDVAGTAVWAAALSGAWSRTPEETEARGAEEEGVWAASDPGASRVAQPVAKPQPASSEARSVFRHQAGASCLAVSRLALGRLALCRLALCRLELGPRRERGEDSALFVRRGVFGAVIR